MTNLKFEIKFENKSRNLNVLKLMRLMDKSNRAFEN